MNERECLKAIFVILMRFFEEDRQDASPSRSPISPESGGPSDAEVRLIEGPEGSGDGDHERGTASVQRFIKRTRPKAAGRRSGRKRERS